MQLIVRLRQACMFSLNRKVQFGQVKIALLLYWLVSGQSALAQYFQFSQYNFSVQRVNPAYVGLTPDAMADFQYRNQKNGGDFQINTNFLSVSYPFVNASTGQSFAGLGLSVLSDRSGPMFKSQEAAATFALHVPTGRYQRISLGFKGLVRWQRINTDGLFTGSQYLEGHGFDPALDNGEIPRPFQNKFVTLSAGLMWQESDRKGKLQKQFGFSFFDFNQPNPSFLDGSQDELPSTIVMHGAWRVYQDKQLGVLPEFLLTRSSTKNVLAGGGRLEYALNSNEQVDMIVKYAVGRSGIAGLQLHRKNYSIGFSYDFPIGKNVANLGAFEIGLEYRTPVDPRGRRELARKKKAKKRKQAVAKKNSTPSVKPIVSKKLPSKTEPLQKKTAVAVTDIAVSQVDTISTYKPVDIVNSDSVPVLPSTPEALAGRINHEPHIIEKITLRFRFEYNSIDLDDETEKFLTELSKTLLANPDQSVQITGHTDNVGSMHLNNRLSLKRAEVVKAYLLKAGVHKDRILTDGKGMDEPLNANSNETERASNRRVEIKLFRP